MDRRSASHVALTVSGAVVLVALAVLAASVRSGAPRGVDDRDAPRSPARATAPVPTPAAPAAPSASRGALRPHEPRAPGIRRVLAGGLAETARKLALRAEPGTPAEGDSTVAALEAEERAAQLAARIQEATQSYDVGDYDSARSQAVQILDLELDPAAREKMLRIAASASCFLGEADQARAFLAKLSPASQDQIALRCRRAGIEF